MTPAALHPYSLHSLSRRNALGQILITGAAVSSGVFVSQSSAQGKPARLGTSCEEGTYIDAHVHIWTPDAQQYPLAEGFRKEDMKPPSFTPEELFAHARPAGIARIVLIQMSFYGYDNSYMLDMIAKHPDVFAGVAVIDPTDQPCTTMKKQAKQGVRGFRIVQGKRTGRQWLASEGMAEMWKCGGEEQLVMGCLCQPDAFSAIGKMAEKYPDTPVVIDHFGRIGIEGKVRDKDIDQLCKLADNKNINVKVSAFYALGKKAAPYFDLSPMTKRVYEAFGPERLMWASDCPYQVVGGHEYEPSIGFIKSLDFLSDEDRQWILCKTADRIYFS